MLAFSKLIGASILFLACVLYAQEPVPQVSCPYASACFYAVGPDHLFHNASLDSNGNLKVTGAAGGAQTPEVSCPYVGSCPYAIGPDGLFHNLTVDSNGNLQTTGGGGGGTYLPLAGGTMSGALGMNENVITWESSAPAVDTGISRLAAGSLAIGNGNPYDASAQLSLANINIAKLLAFNPGLASYASVTWVSQATAFFARLATQPTPYRAAAYNALIQELVATGVWAKLDGLYIFAATDAPTALTNLIQSSYGLTATGSPTFTSNVGYTGTNGSSVYLNTGFNPATASSPNFTQNSASLFAYRSASPAGDAGGLAGIVGGTFKSVLYTPLTGGTPIYSALNSSQGGTGAATDSSGIGLFEASRLTSSTIITYLNGCPFQTLTEASAAPTSADIIFLNDGTSGADGTTGTLAAAGMGAGLTDADSRNLYNAIANYLAAIANTATTTTLVNTYDIASGNATGLSYGTGIARLADGRLIAVWSVGTATNTNAVLYYALSSNNGLTWGAAQTLATPASGYTYTEANVMVTSSGWIVVNVTYYANTGSPFTPVTFVGTVSIPGGSISWSSANTISSALTYPVSDGEAVQLSNGQLMIPLYNNSGSDSTSKITVVFSSNDGITWGNETTVTSGTLTGNNDSWSESGFVQLPNGNVYGILRNDNGVTTSRQGWWYVVSTNEGATWSSPVQINTNTGVSRPGLAVDAYGNLLAVGRFSTASVENSQTAYIYSTDGAGAVWSSPTYIYTLNYAIQHNYGYGGNLYCGGFWDANTQTFIYSINTNLGYTLFQQFSPLAVADTGLSRLGAASLAIGNGTAGDYSGSLKLTTLNTQGGRIVKRSTQSGGGTYTTLATDYVLVFTVSTTVALDSGAAVAGTTYRIKLQAGAAAGAQLTISPNNSKTIDNASTLVMSTLGQFIDVCYDGSSNWDIL